MFWMLIQMFHIHSLYSVKFLQISINIILEKLPNIRNEFFFLFLWTWVIKAKLAWEIIFFCLLILFKYQHILAKWTFYAFNASIFISCNIFVIHYIETVSTLPDCDFLSKTKAANRFWTVKTHKHFFLHVFPAALTNNCYTWFFL